MIRFFVLILSVFNGLLSLAQPDTLVLPEFEKTEWRYTQIKDFLPTLESDTSSLSYFGQGTITDLLQNTMPLVVRNMGPAHSVSISNRGLAAAHTAVYWHGININSPTTGLADFSLIPSAFIESLGITLGGSGAVMGSGPLGGGIHLNQHEVPVDPVRIDWINTLSSTGNLESSLRAVYSAGGWTSKTNLVWNESQNRFPYINRAHRENPLEYRENSQFSQRGLTQHLSREMGKHEISLDLWGLETNRQLPPSLTASDNNEQQYDRNLKAVLQGNFNFNKIQSRVQIGFIDDVLRYQNADDVNAQITSSQWVGNADFTGLISRNWKLRWGTNNTFQSALAEGNYQREERVMNNAFYAGANYGSGNDFWEASVMLRYEVFSNYRDAASPSLGLKVKPLNWFEWHASASRNYRIPGLNDRFWYPGGNPELDPEDAYQFNTGPVFHVVENDHHNLKLEASGFYNFVRNWIQWIPQGNFWGAVNYKSVKTLGINASAHYAYRQNNIGVHADFHCVWTDGRNQTSAFEESLSGSKLPHMPNHKATGVASISWKTIQVYLNGTYTGYRYLSTDNDKVMDPFLLTNGGLSWLFRVNPVQLELSGRVHNVLNANYEVMPWMPMPLRTYSVSLKISFNQKKDKGL